MRTKGVNACAWFYSQSFHAAPFVQVDEPESCDHGVSLFKHCGQCAWLDNSQLNEELFDRSVFQVGVPLED